MGRDGGLIPCRKTTNLSLTKVEFSRKFASIIIESPLRRTVVARNSGRRKSFSCNDVLYEGVTHNSESRVLCGKP